VDVVERRGEDYFLRTIFVNLDIPRLKKLGNMTTYWIE